MSGARLDDGIAVHDRLGDERLLQWPVDTGMHGA